MFQSVDQLDGRPRPQTSFPQCLWAGRRETGLSLCRFALARTGVTGRWKVLFPKSYQTEFPWEEGRLGLRSLSYRGCCKNCFKLPPFPPIVQFLPDRLPSTFTSCPLSPPTALGRLKKGRNRSILQIKKLRLKDVCQTSQNEAVISSLS